LGTYIAFFTHDAHGDLEFDVTLPAEDQSHVVLKHGFRAASRADEGSWEAFAAVFVVEPLFALRTFKNVFKH
jgi:hypothetical protein